MHFSNETLAVLKNFAAINGNIVFQGGNTIKTMSESKTIMAQAEIDEEMPGQIGIYDLNEFLAVIGMFKDATVKISDDLKSARISSGRHGVTYYFSEIGNLTYPSKDINMPNAEIEFTLTAEDLNSIRKASSTLGASHLVVEGKEGLLPRLVVTDIADATANTYDIDVEDADVCTDDFRMVFSIANFKFLADDYRVAISSKLISQFIGQSLGTTYFVAVEKDSTFG